MRKSLAAAILMASLLNPGLHRLLDPVWSFLNALGNAPANKAGCGMDPDGRCTPAALPSSDAGCGMDPFGRCTPAAPPSTDAGGGWDPFG